jgi:MerR family transcriptional regulator, light-induced transcriptional regulator
MERHRAAAAALAAKRASIVEALTARHFAARPDLERRYGAAGKEKCRQEAEYHLGYLEQAVAFAAPDLFSDYVGWASTMLESRGIPPHDLADQLRSLLGVLRDELSAEAMAEVNAVLTPALARPPVVSAAGPGEASHPGRFLRELRERGPNAAGRLVGEMLASGMSLVDVYVDVLQASQHEIGRLWQRNLISVAEEHYYTAATQLVLAQLYPQVFSQSAGGGGPRVVIACVPGELHELGARMVADVAQLAGLHAYFLGANLPVRDLIGFLAERHARVLGLSATIAPHLARLAATIRAVRDDPRTRDVGILVGGYPFARAPELWRSVGADACAADAREAVEVIKRLSAGAG